MSTFAPTSPKASEGSTGNEEPKIVQPHCPNCQTAVEGNYELISISLGCIMRHTSRNQRQLKRHVMQSPSCTNLLKASQQGLQKTFSRRSEDWIELPPILRNVGRGISLADLQHRPGIAQKITRVCESCFECFVDEEERARQEELEERPPMTIAKQDRIQQRKLLRNAETTWYTGTRDSKLTCDFAFTPLQQNLRRKARSQACKQMIRKNFILNATQNSDKQLTASPSPYDFHSCSARARQTASDGTADITWGQLPTLSARDTREMKHEAHELMNDIDLQRYQDRRGNAVGDELMNPRHRTGTGHRGGLGGLDADYVTLVPPRYRDPTELPSPQHASSLSTQELLYNYVLKDIDLSSCTPMDVSPSTLFSYELSMVMEKTTNACLDAYKSEWDDDDPDTCTYFTKLHELYSYASVGGETDTGAIHTDCDTVAALAADVQLPKIRCPRIDFAPTNVHTPPVGGVPGPRPGQYLFPGEYINAVSRLHSAAATTSSTDSTSSSAAESVLLSGLDDDEREIIASTAGMDVPWGGYQLDDEETALVEDVVNGKGVDSNDHDNDHDDEEWDEEADEGEFSDMDMADDGMM